MDKLEADDEQEDHELEVQIQVATNFDLMKSSF